MVSAGCRRYTSTLERFSRGCHFFLLSRRQVQERKANTPAGPNVFVAKKQVAPLFLQIVFSFAVKAKSKLRPFLLYIL